MGGRETGRLWRGAGFKATARERMGMALAPARLAATGAACLLAGLLCLASPAGAFWGDYGPEPPPEIFGVRLGDDIRNYKEMERIPQSEDFDFMKRYVRKENASLTFEGVPLWRANDRAKTGYSVYNNKIYEISFSVHPANYEETARKVSAMFGPPIGYDKLRDSYSRYIQQENSGYIWMNSEVFIRSYAGDGYFSLNWLPVYKTIYDKFSVYAYKWDNPVVCGKSMVLGGKIDDYPSLTEIYREGPEVIHYINEYFQDGALETCMFSLYKGVVYALTLVFKVSMNVCPWRETMYFLDLPYDVGWIHDFFGDIQVQVIHSATDIAYVKLTPLAWEANRARLAYYRNLKPD